MSTGDTNRVLAPLRRLGRLREWPDADKCILICLIGLPHILWMSIVLGTMRSDPAAVPYFDREFAVGIGLPIVRYAFGGALLAILGASLLQRRYGGRRNPLLVQAAVQVVVVISAVASYLFGHYTSLFTTTVFVGFGPSGLLLFDRKPVVAGVWTFLAATLGSTVAEQLGWIPYAPLFREEPFANGHLAASWLWGGGSVFLVLMLSCALLESFGIARAREDEARLFRATTDLARTNEEIRGTNDRLARASEELRSAQEQLVQTEKMASLGRLVAEVAHELSNPVSFLHGGLGTLGDTLEGIQDTLREYESVAAADPALAEPARALRERLDLDYLVRETPGLLRVCAEGSDRIRRIVDDLRIFARAGAGTREAVDVVAGVETVLARLDERIERGGVAIRRLWGADGRHASVQANRAQLEQVWFNLLANALDAIAGQPDPEIRVAVRQTVANDVVEVEVEDNGAGIPEESVGRVFEPFFTTKPIGQGTGLGLSIAYGTVQSHGGQIAVSSEAGRGTRVTVRLPVGGEPAA